MKLPKASCCYLFQVVDMMGYGSWNEPLLDGIWEDSCDSFGIEGFGVGSLENDYSYDLEGCLWKVLA